MSNKQEVLLFSYSDKLSTISLWWKAFLMVPAWGYLVLPFVGSIIAFGGNNALQAAFVGIVVWSLAYFLEDILKRKIRIDDGLITHGFRTRELSKLLSIGTDYKGNDVLPRKMILTFAQGKSMGFNVSRLNATEYQRLLKHIESHYPQCHLDPVLNSLLSCKKIARKVLVDDGDRFIIEYRSGQIWRNMRQAFMDTASPWLRFGPLFVAFLTAPWWLPNVYFWLYMPAKQFHSQDNVQTTLARLLAEFMKPAYSFTSDAGKVFLTTTAHPVVAALSFAALAYTLVYAVRTFTRPNSLSIDTTGLSLAISMAGNSLPLTQIKWDQVSAVSLEKAASGISKIKFQMKGGDPFFLDLSAVQQNDRPRLARALEHFAPGCTIESELNEALMPSREHSYTELWLQSLSVAPERNNMQALAPGQCLNSDQYKVLKRLGVGGQGTAYLCRDQINNCDIVLKETIVPAYADRALREQALKGFEKEAKILESLDCDGIVKLKDYFFEDHRGYIGLEHIDGQNLRQLVALSGPLSEERAWQLAQQMCSILAYLHERSIIHRDFTPDNLILTRDNKLKLIDFNVAQTQQVGTTGTIAGKHSYLPPEQFRGKASCQSDIYAMGATLHFLVTGKDPEAISQSSPIEAGVPISEGFDQMVRACTALDLNKRTKSAAELAVRLTGEPQIEGQSISSTTIKINITEKEKMQA
jgi:tRNA A-37 threonylcarbamoyl transferase component Bud32